MTFIAYKKATVLIPDKRNKDSKHLYIVTSDKNENNRHLIVNVSSIKPEQPYDVACVFNSGCHPFIKQDSFVFYALAKIVHHGTFNTLVDNKTYVHHKDIDDQMLDAVCKGFENSKFLAKHIREFYSDASRKGLCAPLKK